jgi:hypothetical protein
MSKPQANGHKPSLTLWGTVLGGFVGGQFWLAACYPDGWLPGWCVLAGAALGLITGGVLRHAVGWAPSQVGPLQGLLLLYFGLGQWFILNDFVATTGRDEDKEVPLRLVVLDGQTHAAVPGARVMLSLEAEPRSYQADTDSEGIAKFTVLCHAQVGAGWFVARRSVYFYGWHLHVSKAGYTEVGPTWLGEYIEPRLPYADLPPPPISIKLAREPKLGK